MPLAQTLREDSVDSTNMLCSSPTKPEFSKSANCHFGVGQVVSENFRSPLGSPPSLPNHPGTTPDNYPTLDGETQGPEGFLYAIGYIPLNDLATAGCFWGRKPGRSVPLRSNHSGAGPRISPSGIWSRICQGSQHFAGAHGKVRR